MSDTMSPLIRGAGGSPSSSTPRTPVEAPDSLYSIAYARVLDLISEGEIAGLVNGLKSVYLDETPVMNADGSLNFKNVQVDSRVGTPDQDYIPGFQSIEAETLVGVELVSATPWVQAITNLQLSALRVRLSVPSLNKTNNTNGDITGHLVDYAIDVATDGGAYVEVFKGAFSGKTSSTYERSHRVDLPKATTTGWLIRVRRITPNSVDTYVADKTYVQSYTTLIDAKMRYPYSALIGIAIDASQFRSIPRRAYDMLGMIIQVPVNYDPVTRVYTGVWNGTFKMAWTNNPAWIYYAMVTNARYGLGSVIDAARVDKWALYKIAQYCDGLVPDGKGGMEPRFTCTVYLQRRGDAYKVLQDLASVFRGIAYWGAGQVIPVADMPEDPVYTYTNANVKEGRFTYQGSGRRARHSVALVQWSDPADFGRGKVEHIEDEASLIRYGLQETSVTAFGCTSQSQARRIGKWILFSERLETDTVNFTVGLDGTLIAPGKIIRVADADRMGKRVGGRISASTATTITVDKLPSPDPAVGDFVIVALPTGLTEKRTIQSVDVGTRTVTVTVAFSALPVSESIWAIESTALIAPTYRILAVTESEKTAFGITALRHEPQKFDAVELGLKVETRPTSIMPARVQAKPTGLTLTAHERAGSILASPFLQAKWLAVDGATEYVLQWQKDNGEWSPPQPVMGTSATYDNAFMGVYSFRIWALNAVGIPSPMAVSAYLTVADQTRKPGFLEDIVSDNVLTPGEKPAIVKERDVLVNEQAGIDAQATSYAIATEKTAYDNAVSALTTYLATLTAPVLWSDLTGNTTIVGATFKTKFTDVYAARQTLLNKLTDASTKANMAGGGVNLLPDEYSTFEQPTLPPLTNSPAIILTRTTDGNSVIKNSLYMGTGSSTVWFGANAFNIPLTPGKKYLVSFWARSALALNTFRPFIETAAGYTYGNPLAVTTANVFQRLSSIIDMSANTQNSGWLGVTKEQIEAGYIDGLMVEELVGNLNTPSAYARGSTGSAVATAVTKLADIASDNMLTPGEKPTVIKERDVLVNEQAGIDAKATALAITTEKTAYDNAVSALTAYLATLAAPTLWSDLTGNTTIVGATFRQKFLDVYAARQTLLNKIAVQTLDQLPDGTTYGRPLNTRLNGGKPWIDFGETIHSGKHLDNLADGTVYGRQKGATLLGGVPRGISFGNNLCPNASFAKNVSAVTAQNSAAAQVAGTLVCDDWRMNGISPYHYVIPELATYSALLMRLRSDVTIPANLGYTATDVYSTHMDVIAGRSYRISAIVDINSTAAPPAGLTYLFRINHHWIKADGSTAFSGTIDWWNGAHATTYTLEDFPVAPANAVKLQINLEVYIANGNAYSLSPAGALWLDMRWHRIQVALLNNLDTEVQHGTTYGKVANTDLLDSAGIRRIGLRVAGSGQRPGDLRNQLQIAVMNQSAKVPTVVSYSAAAGTPATATISIAAFTALAGSVSVAYNAMSVGVTGTNGTTVVYYLYFDDPAYAGGTQTLVATTSASVPYQNDGRVYAGSVSVVYPASGTSSGSGDPGGGQCVCTDMLLHPGVAAADACKGLVLDCLNLPTGEALFTRAIDSVDFADAECVRIVTDAGATLDCSVATPFDVLDGRTVYAPDMLGETVVTDFGLETVASVTCIGVRPVAHIHLGGVSYAAGKDAYHRIYSHNIKP